MAPPRCAADCTFPLRSSREHPWSFWDSFWIVCGNMPENIESYRGSLRNPPESLPNGLSTTAEQLLCAVRHRIRTRSPPHRPLFRTNCQEVR